MHVHPEYFIAAALLGRQRWEQYKTCSQALVHVRGAKEKAVWCDIPRVNIAQRGCFLGERGTCISCYRSYCSMCREWQRLYAQVENMERQVLSLAQTVTQEHTTTRMDEPSNPIARLARQGL
jgi:hypothetical protein